MSTYGMPQALGQSYTVIPNMVINIFIGHVHSLFKLFNTVLLLGPRFLVSSSIVTLTPKQFMEKQARKPGFSRSFLKRTSFGKFVLCLIEVMFALQFKTSRRGRPKLKKSDESCE